MSSDYVRTGKSENLSLGRYSGFHIYPHIYLCTLYLPPIYIWRQDWSLPFLFSILLISIKYWSLFYPESNLIISHWLARLSHLLGSIPDKLVTHENLKCSLPPQWCADLSLKCVLPECIDVWPADHTSCTHIWDPCTSSWRTLYPVAVSHSGWQRVWGEEAHLPMRQRLLQINSWCLCHMGGLLECFKRLSSGLKHFRSSGVLCPEAEMRWQKVLHVVEIPAAN